MKIPKSFKQKLKKKEEQERKEKLEEVKEDEKRQRLEKKHTQKERQVLSEKIEICKKIFLWREQFLITKEGTNLFNREDYSISLFSKKYNYETNSKGGYHFPIHGLRITDNGITYAVRNSCWGEMKYEYDQPEKLANKIPSKFLKQAWSLIESGKVFNRMSDILLGD